MKPKVSNNKPKNKGTMLDFIKSNQTDSPLEKQTAIAQTNIHAFKYTDEYLDQVKTYNTKLKELDPLYSSVTPLHGVLIRVELFEPTKVGSLVMPHKETIPIKTHSGIDSYASIETDFPYAPTAIVVSCPESNPLKPGDMILLSRKAIQMNIIGTGANAQLRVDNSFTHPTSKMFDTPTDVTSQHYGYALIQYHEIKAKL
jgi:hypothetical protein